MDMWTKTDKEYADKALEIVLEAADALNHLWFEASAGGNEAVSRVIRRAANGVEEASGELEKICYEEGT